MRSAPIDAERALITATAKRLGLTQAQLAEALGVAPTTLRSWITAGASRRPMLPAARKLCRAYLRHPRLVQQIAADEA